jgi:O-acetylserine/cysteine efflux transporter
MPIIDRLAALLLVVIWGLNFIAIRIGVDDVPPLFLGALRFIFVAFPAIFFVPRPNVPFRLIIAYALPIGFGQFAFLFSAISAGMPAGLASLVLQSQVLMTLALSAILFGERIQVHNVVGVVIALAGLAALVAASAGAQTVTILGFALTLCAALCWALGNVANKAIGPTRAVSLIAWSGLVPVVPFLLASAALEGVPRIVASLAHATPKLAGVVAFLSLGASLVGYSLWARLLARHSIWKVAPLPLLVPVVGMGSAWFILGETLTMAQVAASAVILAGLVVNMFGRDAVRLLLRTRW